MIRKGDLVTFKPQWRDEPDEKPWLALEDEDGGRVLVEAQRTGMAYPPTQRVMVDWLEPCLSA